MTFYPKPEPEPDPEPEEGKRLRLWNYDRMLSLGLTPLDAALLADVASWHDVDDLIRRGVPAQMVVHLLL